MPAISDLHTMLEQAKNELIRMKTTRDLFQSRLKEVQGELDRMGEYREVLDKVRILFQLSSDHARAQAKSQLETVVTNALQYVFGPTFYFEIELSDHGGNPVAEFYVVTRLDQQEIKNKPQDARGGGIVDIVSLALRIALLETIRPRLEGPIFLDEPGKHVSEDYIMPMVEFLKSVGETFGRQIILVTHNTHLVETADTSYHVTLSGNESKVTPI